MSTVDDIRDITVIEFVKALYLLGYRLTIVPKETLECNDECCNECNAEAIAPVLNPFIERDKQETAEIARLGLDDIPSYELWKVRKEAEKRIKDGNITNDDDICKVYAEAKRQWLEYKEYIKEKQ